MKNVHWLFGGLLGLAVTGAAPAQDTVVVEERQGDVLETSTAIRGDTAMNGPNRGASMDQVVARFGEPASRLAAVGGNRPLHPPITRWVYPEFTVYFEHDKVIDSVTNAVAAAPTPEQ